MSSRQKRPRNAPTTSGTSDKPKPRPQATEPVRLTDEQKQQLVEQTALVIQKTSIGPLPSPADFAQYEQVLPGSAHRIMSMAEKEQQIRADGQAGMLANDRKRIYGATLLGLALIFVAGIATWSGNSGIAIPLGLAGVISIILRKLMDWMGARKKPNQ